MLINYLNIVRFMKQKPRIGLVMRLEIESRRFYLGRDYSEALEGFGTIPLHLPLIPNKKYIVEALQKLDGILLPGNDSDINPLLYGEDPHSKFGKVVPEKDMTDLLVLTEAERLSIPVLGICFGMQVLNVFRGGTLFHDIDAQISKSVKHEQGKPLDRNSHTIEIEKGSLLSGLITADKVTVNSHHHQSIKQVGENLKPTAWAKDGVIECIEDTREERFNLGVQWHPEYSWKMDKLSSKIFETFVEFSTKYSNGKKIK